ncbi:hypothetical protein BH11PLA1_BH11PLA1_15890 [soil metagenome]
MNDLERRTLLSAAGVGAMALMARVGRAGPLDPPVGDVAPTGRTLDEIYDRIPTGPTGADPRIPIPAGGAAAITLPGSYILGGDINSDGATITIDASNVTLDLNGFTVSSSALDTAPAIDITDSAGAGVARITIRNGRVTGGSACISAAASVVVSDILLDDLRIARGKRQGISFPGTTSRDVHIRRCHISDTGITTSNADANLNVTGILISAPGSSVIDSTVFKIANSASGASSKRGIFFNNPLGIGNIVSGCMLVQESGLGGIGLNIQGFTASGNAYRANAVLGFANKYIVDALDGGGNV